MSMRKVMPSRSVFASSLSRGRYVALGVQVAIGTGMQLDHLRPDAVCGLDLAPVRSDENRYPAAQPRGGAQ